MASRSGCDKQHDAYSGSRSDEELRCLLKIINLALYPRHPPKVTLPFWCKLISFLPLTWSTTTYYVQSLTPNHTCVYYADAAQNTNEEAHVTPVVAADVGSINFNVG